MLAPARVDEARQLINEGKLTRVKVGGCSLITWESAQALIKCQGGAEDAAPQR